MNTYKYNNIHIWIHVIIHTNVYVLTLGINTNSNCQI